MAVSSPAQSVPVSLTTPVQDQPLSQQLYAQSVVNQDQTSLPPGATTPTVGGGLLVGQPNDILVGAGPGPHLLISGGDSLLIGGPGNNLLLGAPPASASATATNTSTPFDVFDPGLGSHTLMVGGIGNDFFVFGAGSAGQTVIANFNPASDQVDIQTGPPGPFMSGVHYTGPVTDSPGGTVIPLPAGGQVELLGIHPASLMPGDLLAFG